MRILMVLTSLTVGGVQRAVQSLSSELVESGHEVGVVSLCKRDTLQIDGRVQRWSFELDSLAGSSLIRAQRALKRVISEFRPEVVHSHAVHSNLVSALALGRRRDIHHVATIHSVCEGGPLHSILGRGLYRGRRSVVAVSAAVAAAHRLSDRATVIHNAIDVRRYAFDPQDRRRVRDELGVTESTTLILSVGRLTQAKDYPCLVSAVARAQRSDIEVVVAGGGDLAEDLEARALREGASGLRFLGAREDVRALMSAADVYVQSSAWEGFPVALLEAMAAGLPIIATRVGGTSELSPPPAIMVPAGNVAALAQALEKAPALIAEEAERVGAPMTMEHYAVEGWCARWVSLYAETQCSWS